MNPTSGESGLRRLIRFWWSSLPLRVLATTFVASCVILVLAGLVLTQQTVTGIVDAKRASALREAAGMQRFMQEQLMLPEMRGVATYEQLSRLAELAGAQAGQFQVIIQGPASRVYSTTGILYESIPVEMAERVQTADGMFIVPTRLRATSAALQGQPGIIIGSTLLSPVGERFPVFYVFPMTSEVATLVDVQRAVVSTGAALLIGLTAIAYLVTLQVVRPVRKASRTALRLASGQLDERMTVRGSDDLASLAVSMNTMASDLQQRIRELEHLSAVQRRFVSDVSHELRTPMTTIKMAADLLYEGREDLGPQDARTVELMTAEIERFSEMLADLLEISRIDAGVAVLDLEDTDLDALVRSEIDSQRSFAVSQGSVVRFHGDDDARAQVDPRRISRILRNLLTNAIDHGEGNPIDVTVAADEEAVAVTVRDRGVGFEANDSARVFDRFWRADPSRARRAGGTGLGLAISLEDARLHSGWLSAWGRPGRGAQFRLTLPRRQGTVLNSSPLPIIPVDVDPRKEP